ncbi:uncharacterized protein LOC141691122 [Apium graveolens]|uniref:uncharacterized protein LOC141691122 n=1 Tax=Apium graveolens TaxID=4045 RepID=UPI003D792CC8
MSGHKGIATIILEVIALSHLWIWHAFFGVAGSNNDINVLDRSPIFDDVLQGRAPEVNYTINGNNYNVGYYLPDGIYPEWTIFIKKIPHPQVFSLVDFVYVASSGVRRKREMGSGVVASLRSL